MGGGIFCEHVGAIYVTDCVAIGDGSLINAIDAEYIEIKNNTTLTTRTPYILDKCNLIIGENNHHRRIFRYSMLNEMILRAIYG